MALASPGIRYSMQRKNEELINSYPVRNSMTIYYGALVGLSVVGVTDGRLVNWSSSSGALRFLGIAIVKGNRDYPYSAVGTSSGNPAAAPSAQSVCEVYEGGAILENVSVTGVASQSDEGKPVYASDENTFTLTATSNVGAVGRVRRYRTSTKVDIELFSAMEYMALESVGKV